MSCLDTPSTFTHGWLDVAGLQPCTSHWPSTEFGLAKCGVLVRLYACTRTSRRRRSVRAKFLKSARQRSSRRVGDGALQATCIALSVRKGRGTQNNQQKNRSLVQIQPFHFHVSRSFRESFAPGTKVFLTFRSCSSQNTLHPQLASDRQQREKTCPRTLVRLSRQLLTPKCPL